jgi:hypothetical protein
MAFPVHLLRKCLLSNVSPLFLVHRIIEVAKWGFLLKSNKSYFATFVQTKHVEFEVEVFIFTCVYIFYRYNCCEK